MPLALHEVDVALLGVSTVAYVVAWTLYCSARLMSRPAVRGWADVLVLCAVSVHVISFGVRGYGAGHLPIYTSYEFATAFAGGIVLAQVVFERRVGWEGLGLVTLPVALMLLVYAGTQPKAPEPLISIFRSLWLKVHILTAFVAYASFTVAFAASLFALFGARSMVPEGTPGALDSIAYLAVKVGFVFLTLCVISGAIWAEFVWGSFWSWDPKETWSLITWLIYAAYLHSRYQRGWRGTKAAVLGVVGFVLVVITYLGVDFLIPRRHDFQPTEAARLFGIGEWGRLEVQHV